MGAQAKWTETEYTVLPRSAIAIALHSQRCYTPSVHHTVWDSPTIQWYQLLGQIQMSQPVKCSDAFLNYRVEKGSKTCSLSLSTLNSVCRYAASRYQTRSVMSTWEKSASGNGIISAIHFGGQCLRHTSRYLFGLPYSRSGRRRLAGAEQSTFWRFQPGSSLAVPLYR